MTSRLRLLLLPSVVIVTTLCSSGAFAQTRPDTPGAGNRPTVVHPVKHDKTPALRDMPPIPIEQEENETPHPPLPVRGGPKARPHVQDPLIQTSTPLLNAITPLTSFGGIGNLSGVLPPDTNGDVGPSHYIQWVNLSFAIFDKAGTTLYGPVSGKTLWQGFGGPCETRNDGDPIVLYDEIADRWLMTQFALPNYPRGPYYQCLAVSTTGNPLGSWNRYRVQLQQAERLPEVRRLAGRLLHVDQSVHLQRPRQLFVGRRGRRRLRTHADAGRCSGARSLLRHGVEHVTRRDAAVGSRWPDAAAGRGAELFHAVRRSARPVAALGIPRRLEQHGEFDVHPARSPPDRGVRFEHVWRLAELHRAGRVRRRRSMRSPIA